MTAAGWASALAVVAPVLTIIQCLIQALRIHRSGARGVSLATWLFSVFCGAIWLSYGFLFHVPAEVVASAPFLVMATVVVALSAHDQHRVGRALAGLLGLAALTLGATLLGTDHAHRWVVAVLAVASSVVLYLPQLVVALRSRDLSGVSVVSAALGLVTSGCWLAYGLLIHQPPIYLPCAVIIPSIVIILVQVARHRLEQPLAIA